MVYRLTSKTCGSIMIAHVPALTIVSREGLPGSSYSTPFFFVGFDQYFWKRPSLSHFFRDLSNDSAMIPLPDVRLCDWYDTICAYLSAIVCHWAGNRGAKNGLSRVGSGLPGIYDVGRGSGFGCGGGAGGSASGVATFTSSGVALFLFEASSRAAARAGTLLFLSIDLTTAGLATVTSKTRREKERPLIATESLTWGPSRVELDQTRQSVPTGASGGCVAISRRGPPIQHLGRKNISEEETSC